MGAFKAAIITDNGNAMIANAVADIKTIRFSKVVVSSHEYPEDTVWSGLTTLDGIQQETTPTDVRISGTSQVGLRALFTNANVSEKYKIQMIGIYATDGDSEVLFAISKALQADEMPAYVGAAPSSFIYNISLIISRASAIQTTVDPAGTATVQDIMDIESPEFDDSGTVEGISSFPTFLETMKSKMNFFQFFRNLKAGLQFVLHAGQIVNNCVTDNSSLPLSAAQGKVLKDLYTQLYSDMQAKNSPYGNILAPGDASGLNVNGYLMSRFGLNGVPTSKKGDKYYIAVDANNKLRSGIQVNGADKITWKEVATKDDLGSIATHSVALIKGTTSNTKGGTVTLKYPAGYTLNNCVVMAYNAEGVVNGFENRIQLTQNSAGVSVYTNHDALVSKSISIWLYS